MSQVYQPDISKIMEQLLRDSINTELKENDWLYGGQRGSMENRSCQTYSVIGLMITSVLQVWWIKVIALM